MAKKLAERRLHVLLRSTSHGNGQPHSGSTAIDISWTMKKSRPCGRQIMSKDGGGRLSTVAAVAWPTRLFRRCGFSRWLFAQDQNNAANCHAVRVRSRASLHAARMPKPVDPRRSALACGSPIALFTQRGTDEVRCSVRAPMATAKEGRREAPSQSRECRDWRPSLTPPSLASLLPFDGSRTKIFGSRKQALAAAASYLAPGH